MSGRKKGDRHIVDRERHAEFQRLELSRTILAIARLQDGNRIGRRQHRPMPIPSMIRMPMRNNRPLPRHARINEGVYRLDMQVPVEDLSCHEAVTLALGNWFRVSAALMVSLSNHEGVPTSCHNLVLRQAQDEVY